LLKKAANSKLNAIMHMQFKGPNLGSIV